MKLPSSLPALNDRWLAWIVFPVILLIYLLFPSRNYYWDGIFFARVIEDAPQMSTSLLHPNHLVYNFAGYFLYQCSQALGLSWRAVDVLQFANSIFSVLTAFLLFKILKSLLKSSYLAWTLTLLFAFSATWWKFSIDANAYVLSVFFLVMAFGFLLPESKPRPLIVALIFSLAVLVHQLAVVCYPVLALGLWWQDSSRRRSNVIQFCVLAFILVFGTYVYCAYLTFGSFDPTRFRQWVTSYSPDASFSFDLLSNLGYTLRGHSRLFFYGRFSHLKGLLTPPILGLIGLLVLMIFVWLSLLIRGLSKPSWPRLKDLYANRFVKLASLWIAIYVFFLFFWLPQNTFYRLFYLPAIIILFGELLASRREGESAKRTYRVALFVFLMALGNFLFYIFPYSHADKFPPLSAALEMNRIWQPGTTVFYGSENSDNNLFRYFNRTTNWKSLPEFQQLEAELQKNQNEGKEAWLEASAIDRLNQTPEGAAWLARHTQGNTLHERKDRGYNIKFVRINP